MKAKRKTVYFENKNGFGLFCKNGLPVNKILATIKKLHGESKILSKIKFDDLPSEDEWLSIQSKILP